MRCTSDGHGATVLGRHDRGHGPDQRADELLERRVALLRVLRTALGEQGVYVRIGQENEIPAMRSLGLVATGYGVASASWAPCR